MTRGGTAAGSVSTAFTHHQRGAAFPWLVLIAIPLVLLITGLATHFTLNKIERHAATEIEHDLKAVLKTTHAALEIWMEEKQRYVGSLAQNPRLLALIKQQLAVGRDREQLLRSDALTKLRQFHQETDALNSFGFMVIAPDHINIATRYDTNTGQSNLIAEQRPDLLNRVFSGETLVISPINNELPIQRTDGTLVPVGCPIIFIASPVKDEGGAVIAVFAIRIDPAESFAKLAHMGSSELAIRTYPFDIDGHPYLLKSAKGHGAPEQAEATARQIKKLLPPVANGNITTTTVQNYRSPEGVPMLGVLLWDGRYNLGLACEMEATTAMQGYLHARGLILGLLAAATLISVLALAVSILLMRNHNRQLEQRVRQRTTELSAAKEQVEGVLAAIPDAIIQVDEQGLIRDANLNAERLLGYTREELCGMELEQLVPERLRESHRQQRREMMAPRTGAVKPSRPLLVLDKGGQEIDVEINVNAFRVGESWMAVAGLRDIRERVRSEREREQLQLQLAQASKMKTIGQLTGGIAHDFNNMLTSIMGFAELSARLVPPGNPKLVHYLEAIEQSSQRASDLVKQMLAFSRGSGSVLQPLAAGPIIGEALKMLRATLPATLQLDSNLEAAEATVRSDTTQLHQLVMNLVINARDALEGRGRIEVGLIRSQTTALCNSCHEPFSGNFVEIYVQDDGPGIAAEYIHRIFDPFFSTKEVGKGTGLGLSIVHGIMHASGGHILVESHLGEGIRIRLLFPDDEQAVVPGIMNDIPHASRETATPVMPHLMIVDDEKSITTFMTDLFESWGYRVTPCNSARDALSCFRENPRSYDLVITDQTMPQMSGTSLCWELIAIRPELPVVLYSGFSGEVNEENYRSYGLRAFFHKPLDTTALRQTIEQLLEQRQY